MIPSMIDAKLKSDDDVIIARTPESARSWSQAHPCNLRGTPSGCQGYTRGSYTPQQVKFTRFFKVGHIKRLQHGIRDIQSGKLPRRLLHPTCGVMSQKVDSVSSMISTTSTYSRMSQSSACSSSYHGAAALTVPPCDLPHIQISNTDMDDSNLGISSEEVFDPGAKMSPRNHP